MRRSKPPIQLRSTHTEPRATRTARRDPRIRQHRLGIARDHTPRRIDHTGQRLDRRRSPHPIRHHINPIIERTRRQHATRPGMRIARRQPMRRDQQISPRERRDPHRIGDEHIRIEQNSDPHPPWRRLHAHAVAAREARIARMQLTMPVPIPARRAKHIAVVQPAISPLLDQPDTRRHAGRLDLTRKRGQRRTIGRLRKRSQRTRPKRLRIDTARQTRRRKHRQFNPLPRRPPQRLRQRHNARVGITRQRGQRNRRDPHAPRCCCLHVSPVDACPNRHTPIEARRLRYVK